MRTGNVCSVGLAMKIDTTTSSHDARNEKIAAANRPSRIPGSVTRHFTSSGPAPQISAASSSDVSKLSSELLIAMIENGNAMIRWPITKPTSVPVKPIRRKKPYSATASTTTGSTIGVRKNALSKARPRKLPRVSASDASSPSITDSTITTSPSSTLVSSESSQPGSANSMPYHCSVQPGGGNISHCELPNESATMNSTGSSRNSDTAPPTPSSSQRNGPRRSKSSSMSVNSCGAHGAAREAKLHRVQRQRDEQQHERGRPRQPPIQQLLDKLGDQFGKHHVFRAAQQRGCDEVAERHHEHHQRAARNAWHRERHQHPPECLPAGRAADCGGAQRGRIDRAQGGMQRHHEKRQHDVGHADCHTGEVIHERERLMDHAKPHQQTVDRASLLQQHHPCESARKQIGPH